MRGRSTPSARSGLYDAKMDHPPVLAIIGQSARRAVGGDYQQEVDLHSLFKDVAHHYLQTCNHPGQVRHLVDRALRIARARRTVTCLIFPRDVQAAESPVPRRLFKVLVRGLAKEPGRRYASCRELVGAARDAHHAAALELCDLPDHRAHGA